MGGLGFITESNDVVLARLPFRLLLLAGCLGWVLTLEFFTFSVEISKLLGVLGEVTRDVRHWAVVWAFVTAAYAFSCFALMPAYGGDTTSGNLFFLDSQLGVGPWATVGEYPIEEVSDASPFIGSWILWIYICFAQVVMLNLLIAMMNRRVDRYYTGMEKGSGDRYFLQLNIARQLPYLERFTRRRRPSPSSRCRASSASPSAAAATTTTTATAIRA